MNRVELPTASGAYRWYYVDVTSGDYTAVFIFMVGSIFSARYSMALKRGGLPQEHAAVNFALYERGVRRLWVLSEYAQVRPAPDGRALHIGDSSLRYGASSLSALVRDRTTPFMLTSWGRPTEVRLELQPEGPASPELRLVEGLDHFWHPIAARSRARVEVLGQGISFEGPAYHDGNHGPVPLGSDLCGWQWVRVIGPQRTDITYQPWSGKAALQVAVTGDGVSSARVPLALPQGRRTSWGLTVPKSLGVAARPHLVESSPFYARAEAGHGGQHALGEVADFRRFHDPRVRWMASFRTRAGGAS